MRIYSPNPGVWTDDQFVHFKIFRIGRLEVVVLISAVVHYLLTYLFMIFVANRTIIKYRVRDAGEDLVSE